MIYFKEKPVFWATLKRTNPNSPLCMVRSMLKDILYNSDHRSLIAPCVQTGTQHQNKTYICIVCAGSDHTVFFPNLIWDSNHENGIICIISLFMCYGPIKMRLDGSTDERTTRTNGMFLLPSHSPPSIEEQSSPHHPSTPLVPERKWCGTSLKSATKRLLYVALGLSV